MDPPLRQICLRSDRRARPSARTHLPAPSLAQRIILCRHPLYRQVPLHLSLLAYVCAQGVDPCRTCLSSVQSDLFMVCTWELLHRFRKSFLVFRAGKEPSDEGKLGTVVHIVERNGGQELQHRWNSYCQPYPQLSLPRLACHVLPPCPR